MIGKQLVFGLLCSTIIQVSPSPDSESPSTSLVPDDKKLPCAEKIRRLQGVSQQTQNLFNEYYSKLNAHAFAANISKLPEIEAEHDEIGKLLEDSAKKYKETSQKLRNISDVGKELAFCTKEIDWYRVLNKNLSQMATHLKGDVLQVLETLGVPPEVTESLDHALSRIVNFLFIIDLLKKTYKDLEPIIELVDKKAQDGIALEKKKGKIDAKSIEIEIAEEAKEIEAKKVKEFDPRMWDSPEDNKIEESLRELNDGKVEQAEREALSREEKLEKEIFEHRPTAIHV